MKMLATIIIPVYNSAWLAEKAILSACCLTSPVYCKVAVYNDGSDAHTQTLLDDLVKQFSQLEVYHERENQGFIKTINHALKNCYTKYAILLNSDVILTDGCIDQMISIAESDARIATVNPLSNRASHIDIPLPPGVNFIEMNEYLKKSQQGSVDIVTGVGFCLLLRMEAIRQVGLFDEIYGKGYCEESDLCMRLTTNGWRTVAAPGTYTYHKGNGSFEDRRERYLKNRMIFDGRWASDYKTQFKTFQKENLIGKIRSHVAPPRRFTPLSHARQVYRNTKTALRQHDAQNAAKALAKGILRIRHASLPKTSGTYIRRFKTHSRLSVTYLLPYLTVAGGVLSVIQLVNELVLLGIDARLATLREYPETDAWSQYTAPMIFKNFNQMATQLPKTDVVVATHWSTVRVADHLQKNHVAREAVYFVQDYEPWFFPEKNKKKRSEVENTYRMLKHQIVKSDWLAQKLEPFGGIIKKITLGMDLNLFYPRKATSVEALHNPIILAMARPRTPRRGFGTLIKGLQHVKNKRPDVRIRFFGDFLKPSMAPFDFEDYGIVTDQNLLARLYSDATLFVDASDFQGFGRTALEAMACGTPCVLTSEGGVGEYARHKENALVVPPRDPEALGTAACDLLDSNTLRIQIAMAGQKTVKRFCHKREAWETAQYLEKLADKPMMSN